MLFVSLLHFCQCCKALCPPLYGCSSLPYVYVWLSLFFICVAHFYEGYISLHVFVYCYVGSNIVYLSAGWFFLIAVRRYFSRDMIVQFYVVCIVVDLSAQWLFSVL